VDKKISKIYIFVSLVCLSLLFNIPNVYAYNIQNAITYADEWALSRNPNWPRFLGKDCTNFVSQCLYAGGIPFDKTGSYQWWCERDLMGFWNWTNSWSVADDHRKWLVNDNHGWITAVWDWNSSSSYPTPPNNSANLTGGEVILYDWESDGTYNHAGFTVGYGTDPDKGSVGDLTDQHNTDRYHSIWHLRDYNANWPTTTIMGIVIY